MNNNVIEALTTNNLSSENRVGERDFRNVHFSHQKVIEEEISLKKKNVKLIIFVVCLIIIFLLIYMDL